MKVAICKAVNMVLWKV